MPCVISKNALSCECLCANTQLPSKSKDCEWDYFSAGLPSNVPVVEVSPVPLTSEELKKQELTLKIQQEYFAALKHEGMLLFGYLHLVVIIIPNLGNVTVKTNQKLFGGRWMGKQSKVEKMTT